jgi:hypothetical protein
VTHRDNQQKGGKSYAVILAEPAQVAINIRGRGAQVRSDHGPTLEQKALMDRVLASARKWSIVDW